jgi:hypothetical protein
VFDYSFHYEYIGRFILYLKYSYEFFYSINILKFNKLSLFFNVLNINDLNSVNILSNVFFFKYYFGVIPFFVNYTHKFKLNIHYYSFFIQYTFFKKSIYYSLYFFLNDIYYMINKINLDVIKNKNF